jgi:hypothetical protein
MRVLGGRLDYDRQTEKAIGDITWYRQIVDSILLRAYPTVRSPEFGRGNSSPPLAIPRITDPGSQYLTAAALYN